MSIYMRYQEIRLECFFAVNLSASFLCVVGNFTYSALCALFCIGRARQTFYINTHLTILTMPEN
jgi:hypothetical protein